MDEYSFDASGERRLGEYLDQIGKVLHYSKRKASFAVYAMGLLGDGDRKSIEPIAARAYCSPLETEQAHDRLHHFLTDSRWSDRDVRRIAARHAVSAMTAKEPIKTSIVDDTGFLKQGTHSVGVQRQYTGTVGKVTNCQLGVSLSVATRSEHAPIDFELYLPRSWTDDKERRKEARIPDDIPFRTKPELALLMVGRAVEDGIPLGVLLADSAYGDSGPFRAGLRSLGVEYAVGVHGPTTVFVVDRLGRRRGEALSVRDLALTRKYRRVTWREGTKQKLSAHFTRLRVIPAHDDGTPPAQREELWLVCEWPPGEAAPSKFYLSTLPRSVSMKQLVRLIKERYRTERLYEDLKGELGLDHYEGRRFPGWHHHISAVLCCFAFVLSERTRHFPPSARRDPAPAAQLLAA
jgi:SRSO17 transposase